MSTQDEKTPLWWWIIMLVVVVIIVLVAIHNIPSSKSATTRIYPNYDFKNGEDEVRVPLIPVDQRLSREAGGWVIVPKGARARFDHDVPIIVENIDGRLSHWVKPDDAEWFGVKPGNGMMRYYGERGKFVTVSIKRNFYK